MSLDWLFHDIPKAWGLAWQGSRIKYASIPAKLYQPARETRPYNGDGLTYRPATGCKRIVREGTVLGHPHASRRDQALAIAHDVDLGPVVVDMQTGDRWPL